MAKNNSDKKKKSNTKTGDSSNIETEEKSICLQEDLLECKIYI